MKVIKFGGSSLATGAQLAKVIKIVQADPTRQVVVVSAPGKRDKTDVKVTDLLGQLADQVLAGKDPAALIETILARYTEIQQHFGLTDDVVARLRQHLQQLAKATYPGVDYLRSAFMAQGEHMNAQLVAAVMAHLGMNARFVSPKALGITLTGKPGAALVADDSYARLAQFTLQPGELIVVPGFYAYDAAGNVLTFARGGSDITGSILAKGLSAELYENFTDVSWVYAADPKIVDHPRAISTLTYREMRELAYAGFSVFNDEALIPVIEAGIRVNIKNTNAPDDPGTIIAPTKNVQHHHHITGVAAKKGFTALYLHHYLINQEVGFTLKLLQILAKYGVSYEHMPSGIDDLTLIIDENQLTPQIKAQIAAEVRAQIHPDELEWLPDFAIVMVVGEGLYARPDLVARIMVTLADAGIEPSVINQGASKIGLMLTVPTAKAAAAVSAIYALSCSKQSAAAK